MKLALVLAALLLFLSATGVCTASNPSAAIRFSLLADPSFQRGFTVLSPKPGRKIPVGQVRPFPEQAPPVWDLAQWSSRFNLAHAKRTVVEPGLVRFFDGAKLLEFDFRTPRQPILTLGLDGITEYRAAPPVRGTPWPHLLVEQSLTVHPRLTELQAIPFHIAFRLVRQEVKKPAGFDLRHHTAQFLLYITVQNQNRDSAGFRDYLWFGVAMYDARYRYPRSHKTADRGVGKKSGTGKFIFNPDGQRYTTQSAHDGRWVTIDRDLLPLMKEALQDAWNKGFLTGSHHIRDYGLGSLNCGWEVPGTWNVAMQVKQLRLDAVTSSHRSNQRHSEEKFPDSEAGRRPPGSQAGKQAPVDGKAASSQKVPAIGSNVTDSSR